MSNPNIKALMVNKDEAVLLLTALDHWQIKLSDAHQLTDNAHRQAAYFTGTVIKRMRERLVVLIDKFHAP